MKTCYFDRDTRAMVDLSPDFEQVKTFWVNRVSVPSWRNRRRGIASALMKEMLSDADTEGITLLLVVVPDNSRQALTRRMLESWYTRLGFKKDGEAPWWRREPQSLL